MTRALTVTLALTALTIFACGGEEAPGASSTRATPTASAPAPPSSTASGHLDYDLPERWTRVEPSSQMRLDEAAIPGPDGLGELAVFFFGAGGGGPVEANLQRWIGQMESDEEPARESFEVGEFSVTWLDISGTLGASSMGAGPTDPQPNQRMFAAVVEGPGGPWFFKATGPETTMADAREEFVAMLRSVKAA